MPCSTSASPTMCAVSGPGAAQVGSGGMGTNAATPPPLVGPGPPKTTTVTKPSRIHENSAASEFCEPTNGGVAPTTVNLPKAVPSSGGGEMPPIGGQE